MSLLEQFTSILEKERESELISFLKALRNEEKKLLTPLLKRLSKDYFDFIQVPSDGRTSYRPKATSIQRKILETASFVCYNQQEFERGSWGIIERESLSKILSWYCPNWFSNFINGFANRDFVPLYLGYDWILELEEDGYLNPTPEFIAKILPNYIYELDRNKSKFKPEKLLKREVTLSKHIWHLFEYENGINWSNRYITFSNATSEEANWISTLKKFSNEGKIDRERLLKESLLASNKNFNKTLSGWFIELYLQLQPTQIELLNIQNELFIALSSPHSKAVNAALGGFKVLVDEKEFRFKEFIEHVPLLLSSDTKSIVSSTLSILEKLLKKQKSLKEDILILTCNVFVHNDDSLQSKAAKLITKNIDSPSSTLREAIGQFSSSLLINSKTILEKFLEEVTVEAKPSDEEASTELTPVISEENKLPSVEAFDDLLFLTSQAFDNNESYHIDLLPSAIINIHSQLKGEDIVKLLPAFQRSLKVIFENLNSNQGYLDHLLAVFFLDYGIFLMEEYPAESKPLEDLYLSYITKNKKSLEEWKKSGKKAINLDFWKTHEKETECETMYEPYRLLLLATLTKIRSKSKLPLLSTPTHKQGWIDPIALIERLGLYQDAAENPDQMDFQIAISRCAIQQIESATEVAEKKLREEYLNLAKFLFGKDKHPKAPYTLTSIWMLAALVKNPNELPKELGHFFDNQASKNYLTGQFKWKMENEVYTFDRFNIETRAYEKREQARCVFKIIFDAKRKHQNNNSENASVKLIPEYFSIKNKYFFIEQNDIKRLLWLVPNNPDPLLAQIIHKCLTYSNFWELGSKKMVTKAIETLYEIWGRSGEMGHLFVATCMLSDDKTIKSFAAEIWIKGVNEGTIDSRLIGEIVGKHQRVEFAPLKRFSDLLSGNMFKVSSKHNLHLEYLITSFLLQLPSTPIANLKKVLEIYLEVLAINQSKIRDERLIELLRNWKDNNLSKAIKGLENMILL
jgi:hypothetical protein